MMDIVLRVVLHKDLAVFQVLLVSITIPKFTAHMVLRDVPCGAKSINHFPHSPLLHSRMVHRDAFGLDSFSGGFGN